MILVGFLQAQNCSNFAASWRHPESRTDFTAPEFYAHIGRVLEEGKFHLAFFDDRLGMPEYSGGNFSDAVKYGIRCVKMDPIATLMPIAMATSKLGLGATMSTTYYEPFHVARMFATLDLMTHGRTAWNIVTSLNDTEARNMGRDAVTEHDLRYDRADEFLEVVLGHWDTWEDDAINLDKASKSFADPEKVRRLEHEGKFFASRGPFTVPRSAQGHPVLIQAGQSTRGQRFASEWGELIFVGYPNLEIGKANYAKLKALTAAAGRDPESLQIANFFAPIVAATKDEAEDKRAILENLPIEEDSLMLLSEALNFDFGSKPLDTPLSDEELESMSGMHTFRDRVIQGSGKSNPSVRDFIEVTQRGRLGHPVVGGPKEVADYMEEFFPSPACDGFVIGASYVPGSYEDFVKFVVPELQRRGLYHKDYAGTTLRENLGFARPSVGAWKARKGQGTGI
ncbi:MAG: LLM class flavin-dependent oxidoreductase [Rhodospirillaceae bacterium]|nr:LLM class flavin-dependent oxidoreductase [Rhodospirillaceae bacterium]